MIKSAFQKEEFEVLWQRLLMRELNKVASSEVHAQIIEEARIAADIAARSGVPNLLFPLLFEERVSETLTAYQRKEDRFWQSFRVMMKIVNKV
jgi:hypothetical protein